ncbi:AraC family transcriptional regulator [Streptomyces sp. NBC_01092]|uniref:helix-turn-helix transcriptional regulator n=1 Tax=Streptomyces sp. NBC_01092 TaxID=2903748 RepID=UPI00386DCD94|nr:AraC family transcriptional regulator [Streptomyces sp. NBC_01092]
MYSWSQSLTFSSAGAWDEAFTGLHGAGRISVPDRDAPWTGRLEWQRSHAYGLALCSGGREVVERDARHIRSDPRGAYELLVPLAGTARVEQGPSATGIRPGQMVLCDVDRPMTFAHDAGFLSVAFMMSGEDVAVRSRVAAAGPQLLDGTRGLGRVVRQLTATLHEEREQLTEPAFDIACDRLLDLVCLAAEGGGDTVPSGQRATVEAAVRRHVRRHACDADLDVASVARALGWSVRHVQQVLQAAGTTARDLIRRERLNVARARLAGAGWAAYSIAEIAHSCGFGSHASFATAFRAEFGMTPREARPHASRRRA